MEYITGDQEQWEENSLRKSFQVLVGQGYWLNTDKYFPSKAFNICHATGFLKAFFFLCPSEACMYRDKWIKGKESLASRYIKPSLCELGPGTEQNEGEFYFLLQT